MENSSVWEYDLMVKPNMHEALGFIPSATKQK
jgi:hypothetical protein